MNMNEGSTVATYLDIHQSKWAFFLCKLLQIYMFAGLNASPVFKRLWKSKGLHRVFVWLFLMDHLNTRDMMDRRHWHLNSGLHCAMCNTNHRETREHLFLNCPFASNVWHRFRIVRTTSQLSLKCFQEAKESFQGPKFFEIATCALLGIWKRWNGKIFEGKRPTFQARKVIFRADLNLVICMVKPTHKASSFKLVKLFLVFSLFS
jgi:hypothetical protein